MSYRKKILYSAAFVLMAALVSYSVESYMGMAKINEKVIRLHVIANSDSFEDQQLKYQVRNSIITTFNNQFKNISSKEDSEKIIIEKIGDIRQEAETVIKNEGYEYEVNVYYGNYKFPRKLYEDIVLPEGYYDSVRIEIGMAEGKNWWCVMFPPLCFVDFGKDESTPIFEVDTEAKLREVLTEEEIETIKTKRGLEEIKLKSKIFEFIEKGKVENTGLYSTDRSKTYAESISIKN
ncbi:stage II sporulation protein R [Sedimentibacter saalensis]|uniref:Stage II sporulation protein R n=1 Tax=Sedimentibacter saalensis TaxID=130788 RepID=A0A562J4T1_9FIRM|nr:stage II sporulation protein R [Sedimentibacter saalensis]TWH77895.1 stage II sporulation protein R [Sedimentibacter saalensis]